MIYDILTTNVFRIGTCTNKHYLLYYVHVHCSCRIKSHVKIAAVCL